MYVLVQTFTFIFGLISAAHELQFKSESLVFLLYNINEMIAIEYFQSFGIFFTFNDFSRLHNNPIILTKGVPFTDFNIRLLFKNQIAGGTG